MASTRTPRKKKNKPGVANTLVHDSNARKKKGIARPQSRTAIAAAAYDDMEEGWNTRIPPKQKKTPPAKAPAKKTATRAK